MQEIPTAPVTGWDAGTIPAYGAVMLCLHYLTHPSQQLQDAHRSPQFVLTASQARELAAALQKKAEQLDAGSTQGSGLPKH